MFDLIAGLPLHVLVIHAVVVLGPLAAATASAHALVPRWRRLLRWPTLLLAVVTGAGAWVAARSGEALVQRVSTIRPETTNFDLLATHQDAGQRAMVVSLVFMVVAVAAALLLRPPDAAGRQSRGLSVGLAALSVATAVAAVVAIVLAGDAGARVVWDGIAA